MVSEGPNDERAAGAAPPAWSMAGALPGLPDIAVTSPSIPSMSRARSRRPGQGLATRGIVALAIVALVAGIGVLMTGPGSGSVSRGLGVGNRDYSYYTGRSYDPTEYSPRWDTSKMMRSRNTWVYDGPYQYGTYGSERLRRGARPASDLGGIRTSGKDVFDTYGVTGDQIDPDLLATPGVSPDPADPTGGYPVGVRAAGAAQVSPYYDPYYAGYANPYLNQLRLRFGQGFGPGAAGP